MVGDREPVRLVADALHEIEPLRRPREDYRVGPRGNKELLALLRECGDRDLQEARVGERGLAGRELPLPAVEDDEIGEWPALAVRRGALEPAAKRLAHVCEVVVAIDDLRPEPSIGVLRGPPVLEHDHRAHHARALHVADVVTLDALRGSLEAECVGQLAKRGVGLAAIGHPAHPFLLEGVLGVALGELREVTLLPALRHEDPHRPTATFRRERLERFHFRYRDGNDDLGRDRGRDRVVLTKERCKDVGGERALRTLEREMVAAHHGPVANAEDLDHRVALFDRGGVHVEVVALVGMHLLPVEGPLDRNEPITQRRGPLEGQRIRCLLHLLLRVARERVVPAFEEEHALIDRASVLVARGVTHARGGATLQVEEEAGTAAGQRGGRDRPAATVIAGHDVELARAVRKELLQEIERLVHRFGVGERPEVASAAVAECSRPKDPRKILAERDLHVGIRLVVLETDVVAGVMLLDEVRLEEERLRDAVGQDVFQTFGALHHPDVPDLETRAEIGPHPIAEDVRLSHIKDAALRVLE